jgi:hypothetical protein
MDKVEFQYDVEVGGIVASTALLIFSETRMEFLPWLLQLSTTLIVVRGLPDFITWMGRRDIFWLHMD